MARLDSGAEGDFHALTIPDGEGVEALRRRAAGCTACPLYRHATQTVFGEGPARAKMILVGEQPGDREDVRGRPFIGPAGQLLDRALVEAGIDRGKVYVSNAVKHFKWEPRGRRRLHKKPSAREIAACRPWLRAEMEAIRPRVVVCLGATAAQAVAGPSVRVRRDRGRFMRTDLCLRTLLTVHPSALLRAPDEASRERDYGLFVKDLRMAVEGL